MGVLVDKRQLVLIKCERLGQVKHDCALVHRPGVCDWSVASLRFFCSLEDLDIEELLETHPVVHIDGQHLANDAFDLLWHCWGIKLKRFCLDVVKDLKRVLSFPRQTFLESQQCGVLLALVVKHEVKDESQRPNIRLLSIALLVTSKQLQNFRTGEQRRANERANHLVLLLQLRSPEIRNLNLPIFQQYIGRFQISMQDILLIHKLNPPYDLRIVVQHLRGQILLWPEGHQQILESAALAELHDHEEAVAADAVIDVSDDIGVAKDLQCVDLLYILLIVQGLLYCHWLKVLLLVRLHDAIPSPNCSEFTATQGLFAVYDVVPVSFVLAHIGLQKLDSPSLDHHLSASQRNQTQRGQFSQLTKRNPLLQVADGLWLGGSDIFVGLGNSEILGNVELEVGFFKGFIDALGGYLLILDFKGLFDFLQDVDKGGKGVMLFLIDLQGLADEVIAIGQCFCHNFIHIVVPKSLPFMKLKRKFLMPSSSLLPYLVQLLHCFFPFSVEDYIGFAFAHEFINQFHQQSLLRRVLFALKQTLFLFLLYFIVSLQRKCSEKVLKVVDDKIRCFMMLSFRYILHSSP